jgi:histidine triad (HIT) family protein
VLIHFPHSRAAPSGPAIGARAQDKREVLDPSPRSGHYDRSVPECLFCGIAAGEIPATVVLDGKRVIAFRDVNPQATTHVLVIPRDHYPNVADLAGAGDGLLDELITEAHRVAVTEGIAGSGYRIVFNTGPEAGQTVGHVHAHVLGGRPMTWPPG